MISIFTTKRFTSLKRSIFYLLGYLFHFIKKKHFLDINSFLVILKYSGHPQVVESLIRGFKINKIKYSLNPKNNDELHRTVVVLSGFDELREVIYLKKLGKIKNIIAGPNIAIQPSEYGDLFAAPEIDVILTASQWMTDFYENDMPELKGKIMSYPSGSNLDYWRYDKNHKREMILIYVKQHNINKNFKIKKYLQYLKLLNFNYKIIYYGSYNQNQFRNLLHKSFLAIFFSMSESQGLALLHSWSADVPTLVFYNDIVKYKHYPDRKCETAPYLTKETGMYFLDFEDFKIKFKKMNDILNSLNPSKWVEENMTDEICANNLLKIVRNIDNNKKNNKIL